MITQDAETFVALGRAMSLAAAEGALEADDARDLAAALVAAILTGSMELDTYARIHEALACLLERTFAGPRVSATLQTAVGGGPRPLGEDHLGVYLEVVGEAWDTVSSAEDGTARVRAFVDATFDLEHGRFGGECWFEAPLQASAEELVRRAKAAGLLIVDLQAVAADTPLVGRLCAADHPQAPTGGRVVFGWGERRSRLCLTNTP